MNQRRQLRAGRTRRTSIAAAFLALAPPATLLAQQPDAAQSEPAAQETAPAVSVVTEPIFSGTASSSAPEAPPLTPEQIAARAELARRAAERRETLATVFDGVLLDAANGQDFAETAGYRRALELLAAMPREDARRRVARDFDWEECVLEPDLWRGEFVHIRGLFLDAWADRMQRPLGEHVDVWRGIVSETDGTEGVVFDMLERPPDGVVNGETVVDLSGMLYRTVRYESKHGKWVVAPYVLGKSLTIVDTSALQKKGVFSDPFMAVLVGAAGVFFISRILLAARKETRGGAVPDRTDFEDLFRRAEREAKRSKKP